MGAHEPLDRAGLEAELRDMLRADDKAVSHALVCPLCDSRDTALHALALAGWDEVLWWQDLSRRGVRGATS